MSWFVDVAMGIAMLSIVGLLLAYVVFLLGSALPAVSRERLRAVLWRIRRPTRDLPSGPPIYRVSLDGQLRYASGREDVEAYLGALWVQASTTLLQRLPSGQSIEIVLLCGEETLVVQIMREP